MPLDDRIVKAIESGKKKAEEILEARGEARERRRAALQANRKALSVQTKITTPAMEGAAQTEQQTAGYLAALGDSWFDYPFHDVLKSLEDDHGYNIESTAHKGDPIEKMAYVGGQIDGFARKLEKIQSHGAIPKAVLLSGGGDDVAGNEFGMLLNSALSPIAGWNNDVLAALLDANERIYTAYIQLITSVQTVFASYFPQRPLHILLHGYDYPVPDGRGFLGGWPFPGPWLQPGFREKSFGNLQTCTNMMTVLIDRFNNMVSAVKVPGATIHYIDLRKTLSNVITNDVYQKSWANELHPTEQGFAAVAQKFANVLDAIS